MKQQKRSSNKTTVAILTCSSEWELNAVSSGNDLEAITGKEITIWILKIRYFKKSELLHPTGHLSFDAAQDTVGFLGCSHTLLGCVELLINQRPPGPPPQGCFKSINLLACVCAWDDPNLGAGPCVWPCWTLWSLHEKNDLNLIWCLIPSHVVLLVP